jgi:hypothetical protein
MQPILFGLLAGIFMVASHPLLADSRSHSARAGGRSAEHMGTSAQGNSNAQFRADSTRGAQRAEERMDAHGGAPREHAHPGADHRGDAPAGEKAQGRGPEPR